MAVGIKKTRIMMKMGKLKNVTDVILDRKEDSIGDWPTGYLHYIEQNFT